MLSSLLLELLPTVTELGNLKLLLTGKKKTPKTQTKLPNKPRHQKTPKLQSCLSSLKKKLKIKPYTQKKEINSLMKKELSHWRTFLLISTKNRRKLEMGHPLGCPVLASVKPARSVWPSAISSHQEGCQWEFCMAFERGLPPYLREPSYKELRLIFLVCAWDLYCMGKTG